MLHQHSPPSPPSLTPLAALLETHLKFWLHPPTLLITTRRLLNNRRFPSCLSPLFQSEKLVLFTCKCVWIILFSIWKASHQDSLWNRGERQLGNRLFLKKKLFSFFICYSVKTMYYEQWCRNRTFAWWRHLNTNTRMHFAAIYLCHTRVIIHKGLTTICKCPIALDNNLSCCFTEIIVHVIVSFISQISQSCQKKTPKTKVNLYSTLWYSRTLYRCRHLLILESWPSAKFA